MVEFKFIDTESENYIDVAVDAEFEKPLENNDALDVVQIITRVLTHQTARQFFDCVISLNVTPKYLAIRLRYYLKGIGRQPFDADNAEEANMRKMQFVFFLFARVDQFFRLGVVPFSPNFRGFLEILGGLFGQ